MGEGGGVNMEFHEFHVFGAVTYVHSNVLELCELLSDARWFSWGRGGGRGRTEIGLHHATREISRICEIIMPIWMSTMMATAGKRTGQMIWPSMKEVQKGRGRRGIKELQEGEARHVPHGGRGELMLRRAWRHLVDDGDDPGAGAADVVVGVRGPVEAVPDDDAAPGVAAQVVPLL